MATASNLLIPALLAMDVYHRYVPGGLFDLVDTLPLPDGVTSFEQVGKDLDIGFVAKAYEYKGRDVVRPKRPTRTSAPRRVAI